MTSPVVTARNETKWSDEAVSPFPIEEVKIPSSILHPKDIKDEIASSAKVMPPRNDK